MKKIALLFMTLFCVVSFAQSTKAEKNKIDALLVGSWSGEEKDQQIEGMHKSWIMHRMDDGKFLLLFVTVQDEVVTTQTEKGQWWIEGGKFYELHKGSGKTDIYDYQVLDKDHVKFKSTHLAIDHENQNYEFIDTRIEDY